MHAQAAPKELAHVFFAGVESPARRGLQQQTGRGTAEGSANPRLVAHSRTESRSLSERDDPDEAAPPDAFLVWLFQMAGLDAGAYRPRALERRLPACLRALRVVSTDAAKAALERHPELLPCALDAVLIGVSGFFRDPAVFEHLRNSVLPKLIERRGGLRVLSVGCAEGQELYSTAMLLAEAGALPDSHLLGVDCRPDAIKRAEAGWFRAAELEAVAPELRARYFRIEGNQACISSVLREKVCWLAANFLSPGAGSAFTGSAVTGSAGIPAGVLSHVSPGAATSAPPGGTVLGRPFWDIILFRNVAIYLKTDPIAGLWECLAGWLRPGGMLVTGKAERPPAGLPFMRIAPCLYEQRAE